MKSLPLFLLAATLVACGTSSDPTPDAGDTTPDAGDTTRALPAAFDPVKSNLVVWFLADDAEAQGTDVTTWRSSDESRTALVLRGADEGEGEPRPLEKRSDEGRAAVRFGESSGTGEKAGFSSPLTGTLPGTGALTQGAVVLRFKYLADAGEPYEYLFSMGKVTYETPGGLFSLAREKAGDGGRLYSYDDGVSHIGSGALAGGAWHTAVINFVAGAAPVLHLDGSSVSLSGTDPVTWNVERTLYIGGLTGAWLGQFDLREVAVFDAPLGATDRAAIETYLGR